MIIDIISKILGILAIVCLVLRLIIYPILCLIIRHANTETQKCKKCKGTMIDRASHLYLIPVMFDDKYEESAEYYINNFQRIEDISQIPNGRRACYLYLFQCQNCGHKNISIVDFLKVRDKEILKGGDIYEYEKFREFLEG